MNKETTKAFINHLDDALVHIDNAIRLEPEDKIRYHLHGISARLTGIANQVEGESRCPKCDRYPSEKPCSFLPKCTCED